MYATGIITYLKSDLIYKFSILDTYYAVSRHSRIYVTGWEIRGYFSKLTGVRKQKSFGNSALH